MRILVTGGTGKTGRRIADRLARDGHAPIVASRTGAAGIAFDWQDVSTHEAAAAGVEAAYLLAPTGVSDPLPAMQPFIERLIAGDTGRLVLLSAAAIPLGGPMMGAVHAWLAEHAPCWTVLRPSWFMQNFSEQQHRATIVDDDAIYSATGTGRVGWIDADDIAAVAAEVLTDHNRANGDLVLTGAEALGYDEVARIIGEAIGRPIVHRNLAVAALTERFESAGMPADYAKALAAMDAPIAEGKADFTTDAVLNVTGRAPASFIDFVERNRRIWAHA